MKYLLLILTAVLSLTLTCHADYVTGAKSKTKYQILDSHTILLTGGHGPDILIKTWEFLSKYDTIAVLKDSFGSYDSAVLYVNEKPIDVTQVTKIN